MEGRGEGSGKDREWRMGWSLREMEVWDRDVGGMGGHKAGKLGG